MIKIIFIAINLFGLGLSSPIAFYNNNWNSESDATENLASLKDHETLSLGSLEGSEGGYGGGANSGGSYYGGVAVGHGASEGDNGASASHVGGGDYHQGVSIVSDGAKGHETNIDLTHHAGHGHIGLFGGSFVTSGKHEGGDGGSHGGQENLGVGGSETSHQSYPGLGSFGGWGAALY